MTQAAENNTDMQQETSEELVEEPIKEHGGMQQEVGEAAAREERRRPLSQLAEEELMALPVTYIFEGKLEACNALRALGNTKWKSG
jgi:hypothetical protein